MDGEGLDEILIDIKGTTLTLGEVLACIEQYKQDPVYGNYEIFLGSDRYAAVARLKVR